jgi:hypothetical protein
VESWECPSAIVLRGALAALASSHATYGLSQVKLDAQMVLSILCLLYLLWMLKSELQSFAVALEQIRLYMMVEQPEPESTAAQEAERLKVGTERPVCFKSWFRRS